MNPERWHDLTEKVWPLGVWTYSWVQIRVLWSVTLGNNLSFKPQFPHLWRGWGGGGMIILGWTLWNCQYLRLFCPMKMATSYSSPFKAYHIGLLIRIENNIWENQTQSLYFRHSDHLGGHCSNAGEKCWEEQRMGRGVKKEKCQNLVTGCGWMMGEKVELGWLPGLWLVDIGRWCYYLRT